MAPFIWRLMINLSRSVAEVSEVSEDLFTCHTYMYFYAPFKKKTLFKLFNVRKSVFYYFKKYF
jgi:hypothetical protein